MRKINKRILSLFLATALSVSMFAGCGKKQGDDAKTNGSSKSVESGGLKVSDNFNATGLPILKKPETFKVVLSQGSTKVEAGKKECYIKTAAETNVNFEFVEIPSANMKEKVNIMFASNDLPDMFMSDIDVATQYEQLTVLDEYIDAYAPNVQKLFQDRPEYKDVLTAPDGKIHFLPGGDEAYMNQIDRQQWINKGWLEKLKISAPTNTDELYNVLKAFKEKDPNGNGQKDEIPLTFNGVTDWATGFGNLFGSFGVVESVGHIFVKDNKVIFAAQEKGFYEGLKYFNKLFSEGLIDPEAFTQSLDQYNTRGKNKDIFGSVLGYRAHYVLGPEQKENFVGVLPLKGPEGTQMITANYINQLTGVQITTACKQPETLVRWYDYVNSSSEMALRWGRGIEGINWKHVTVDGKEKHVVNLPLDPKSPVPIERDDVSFAGQTPALWMLHRDEANSVVDPENPTVDLKKELIAASMPFAVYGMPTGLDTVENTQKKSLLLTDIDTYLKKFIADSVMNGINDTKWEKHLKTLDSLKVKEYMDMCQQFLDK